MDASASKFPVEPLETMMRCVDLVAWAQITARAEQLDLSFVDLRLLLAVAARSGPSTVGDLARLSGLPPDAAHRGVNHLHGRGYLDEVRRRFALSDDGRGIVALLDAAHREGMQTYVDGLEGDERQRLAEAMQMTKGSA